MPLYNVISQRGGTVLQATLTSIETSLAYFQDKYPQAGQVQAEIVIVDDGSTDDTLAFVEAFAQDKPYYQLIKLPHNSGIGAARNIGVKFSHAQALFFCDGDDRFLPEHLFLGFSILNQALPPDQQTGNEPEYFGAVRTGIYTRESLHPHWHKSLENTLVLNLCVRRQVHEFMGGFPEESVFREFKYGAEDVAYATWMQSVCHQARVERKTVEYICYPGSFFERQLAKFQAPPGTITDTLDPVDQARQVEISQIIQARHQQIQAQLLQMQTP